MSLKPSEAVAQTYLVTATLPNQGKTQKLLRAMSQEDALEALREYLRDEKVPFRMITALLVKD